MSHEHRLAGFGVGGNRVQRCQGCFKTAAEIEQEKPRRRAPTQTPVQADSESATLRRNRRHPRRMDG